MIDCGTVLKKNRAQAENDENNKEFKNPVDVDHNEKNKIGLNWFLIKKESTTLNCKSKNGKKSKKK